MEHKLPSSGLQDAAPSNSTPDISPPESGTALASSATVSNPDSTTEASLNEALGRLKLVESTSDRMFRALATIFETSQLHDGRIDLNVSPAESIWTLLQRADDDEDRGERSIPPLIAVKNVLDQLLWLHSQFLLPSLRIVADRSRDATWREPFGQAGLLTFASNVLTAEGASDDLKIQALRLIGNSCADTDENRQRVLQYGYLQVVIDQLENASLISVAVPVVFNICNDFEPAQQQAFRSNLLQLLFDILDDGILASTPSFTYLCRLIDHASEQVNVSVSPNNAVEILLLAATLSGLEIDDCISLMEFAIAHLKLESFQRYMIDEDLFEIPMRFLLRTYSSDTDIREDSFPDIGSLTISDRDAEEERELFKARLAIIQALADVSSLDEFTEKYASTQNTIMINLRKWLSCTQSQLQQCSCIILGNVARSDTICIQMVSESNIHKDLFSILRTSSDSQLLHAALSFLSNLALPERNKSILGTAGAIEVLNRFWTTEPLPQISYAAAGVARKLVNGSITNVHKILTSLSSDKESPAYFRTYLSLLLSTYGKADEPAVKHEIARLVAAVLRCIHSQQVLPGTKEELLGRLYSLHPDLARPLANMVAQSQHPDVRSEGWFAFALMAQTPRGRAMISNVVSDIAVFGALEQTIKGTVPEGPAEMQTLPTSPSSMFASSISPSPQPAGSTQGNNARKLHDRQNAMIMVHELLKNGDEHTLDRLEREQLEDLLHTGSRAD